MLQSTSTGYIERSPLTSLVTICCHCAPSVAQRFSLHVTINRRRRVRGWSPWNSLQGRGLLPHQLWILRRYIYLFWMRMRASSSNIGLPRPCLHNEPPLMNLKTPLLFCVRLVARIAQDVTAVPLPAAEQATVAAPGMVAPTSPDTRRAANPASKIWDVFAPPPSEPPASSWTVRTSCVIAVGCRKPASPATHPLGHLKPRTSQTYVGYLKLHDEPAVSCSLHSNVDCSSATLFSRLCPGNVIITHSTLAGATDTPPTPAPTPAPVVDGKLSAVLLQRPNLQTWTTSTPSIIDVCKPCCTRSSSQEDDRRQARLVLYRGALTRDFPSSPCHQQKRTCAWLESLEFSPRARSAVPPAVDLAQVNTPLLLDEIHACLHTLVSVLGLSPAVLTTNPPRPLETAKIFVNANLRTPTRRDRGSLTCCGAGDGCSARDGGANFTGHEACCKSGVEDLGRVCSATVGAPCIVSDGENIIHTINTTYF